MPNIRGLLLLD